MQAKNQVRNEDELKKIPESELFISESGYAYSIYEIASFIRGGETFFLYKCEYEAQGSFRDFKNIEAGCGRSDKLFTEQDIQELMQHEVIKDAMEAMKDRDALQKYILLSRKF